MANPITKLFQNLFGWNSQKKSISESDYLSGYSLGCSDYVNNNYEATYYSYIKHKQSPVAISDDYNSLMTSDEMDAMWEEGMSKLKGDNLKSKRDERNSYYKRRFKNHSKLPGYGRGPRQLIKATKLSECIEEGNELTHDGLTDEISNNRIVKSSSAVKSKSSGFFSFIGLFKCFSISSLFCCGRSATRTSSDDLLEVKLKQSSSNRSEYEHMPN